MKVSSNQIITVIVAFIIGVAFATLSDRDSNVEDSMENEVIEEGMEEEQTEEEGEETEEASYPNPNPTSTTTTTTTTSPAPVAEPKTSTEFVSGACNTGLSGRKDSKLNAIVINWSPCASDDFQLYRLVKSSKNSNPGYPGDPVAFTSSNKNAANFVDKTVAARTTYYYRMCVVQRLGQMNCSNVATVSF